MKRVTSFEFLPGSRREALPGFSDAFPYIASRAELDFYGGRAVPWHWHEAVELFYIESGALEYSTPGGVVSFPAGSGGMVNSGVLHASRALAGYGENVQLLHIFDPSLISGSPSGRIAQKYVLPLLGRADLPILALHPGNSRHAALLGHLRASFLLDEAEYGYELRLRSLLSEIWLELSALAPPDCGVSIPSAGCDRLKQMMLFIRERCAGRLSIAEIAASAYTSQRDCYRLFHDFLHCSPLEYVLSCRLQLACRMLETDKESITAVAHACGFGSSSYFGKRFAAQFGCTPLQYRRRWQDRDKNTQK